MALVRRAVAADAAAIASVHVASWETTYADILPEEYMAARTVESRRAFWVDCLTENAPGVCVFVACDEEGSVRGFASGGPERTGTLDALGELYSLYLMEAAQGLGLGRALTERVVNELGGRKIAVWVLEENPATGFYERMGGRRLTTRRTEHGGRFYTEVAYDLGSR